MAVITTHPLIRHFRAEPTAYVLRYRRGRLIAEGTALAFWFRPLHAAVAELPSTTASSRSSSTSGAPTSRS